MKVLLVGVTWQFILNNLKFCKGLTQQFYF